MPSAVRLRRRCAAAGTISRHVRSRRITSATPQTGETVSLRVVFATEPANEQRVRALIAQALANGQLTVPEGGVAQWNLRSSSAGILRAEEEGLAADLIAH